MVNNLESILINKWFFTFVMSWIIFFILVDWSLLSKNIWGGIVAILLQLWQDTAAHNANLYYVDDAGVWLLKSSAFFSFGIVFTIGVLYIQYIPNKPRLQLVHLIFFSIGFVIFEFLVAKYKVLIHVHWTYWGSFFDNLIIMGSFLWLKSFILYIKS